jgi:hypothetical protein
VERRHRAAEQAASGPSSLRLLRRLADAPAPFLEARAEFGGGDGGGEPAENAAPPAYALSVAHKLGEASAQRPRAQ